MNSQPGIDRRAAKPRCPVPNSRRSDAAGPLRAALPGRGADGRGADGAGRRVAAGGLQTSGCPQAGRTGARPPFGPPDPLQRPAWRAGTAARLDQRDGRLLGAPLRRPRKSAQEDGPMTDDGTVPEIRTVVIERILDATPEKIW